LLKNIALKRSSTVHIISVKKEINDDLNVAINILYIPESMGVNLAKRIC
jgi:hypothetical protein